VRVFELLFDVRLERVLKGLFQDLLMKFECMLDVRDVLEVYLVRNAQTLHPERVSPLLEVLFKSPSTPVTGASTNLTLKLLAQPMQLIKPVRDRLSVPAHRQILRIVFDAVFVAVFGGYCDCLG
jgi:hypothetical protein